MYASRTVKIQKIRGKSGLLGNCGCGQPAVKKLGGVRSCANCARIFGVVNKRLDASIKREREERRKQLKGHEAEDAHGCTR